MTKLIAEPLQLLQRLSPFAVAVLMFFSMQAPAFAATPSERLQAEAYTLQKVVLLMQYLARTDEGKLKRGATELQMYFMDLSRSEIYRDFVGMSKSSEAQANQSAFTDMVGAYLTPDDILALRYKLPRIVEKWRENNSGFDRAFEYSQKSAVDLRVNPVTYTALFTLGVLGMSAGLGPVAVLPLNVLVYLKMRKPSKSARTELRVARGLEDYVLHLAAVCEADLKYSSKDEE